MVRRAEASRGEVKMPKQFDVSQFAWRGPPTGSVPGSMIRRATAKPRGPVVPIDERLARPRGVSPPGAARGPLASDCFVYGRPPECDHCRPHEACFGVQIGTTAPDDGGMIRFCAPATDDIRDPESSATKRAERYCAHWSGVPDPGAGPLFRGDGLRCGAARRFTEAEANAYALARGVNTVRCYGTLARDPSCAQSILEFVQAGGVSARAPVPSCGAGRRRSFYERR